MSFLRRKYFLFPKIDNIRLTAPLQMLLDDLVHIKEVKTLTWTKVISLFVQTLMKISKYADFLSLLGDNLISKEKTSTGIYVSF